MHVEPERPASFGRIPKKIQASQEDHLSANPEHVQMYEPDGCGAKLGLPLCILYAVKH